MDPQIDRIMFPEGEQNIEHPYHFQVFNFSAFFLGGGIAMYNRIYDNMTIYIYIIVYVTFYNHNI